MKIVNTWYNINCMSQYIGVSSTFSIQFSDKHHCIVLKKYFISLNSRNVIAKKKKKHTTYIK